MKNSTQTTLPYFNFSVGAELNDVTPRIIILINEEINEANCMVRNSAKLRPQDQAAHSIWSLYEWRFQIWRGQNRGGKKKEKKEKKKKKKKKIEREQNHIASPTGIANNVQGQWMGELRAYFGETLRR